MRDFSQAPFLVIWEVTQACDLACKHCRASARPDRDPGELTFSEAQATLRQIKDFGDPLLVFTGGDPLKRPDLFELLRESVALGLRTTVTPSATPLLTDDAVSRIKDCGVSRMAVSLDGADAAAHDSFRQVSGSYDRTMAALRHAARIGLETQINTTVTRHNVESLDRIARVVGAEKARLWSVFFLVVTGRASLADDLTAEEYEQVFEFLYQTSLDVPFDIKTTEAQHYRRYVAQRRKAQGGVRSASAPAGIIQRQAGINDGKGFLFISHTGEIFPSGFLEVSAGNVRRTPLQQAYCDSGLFRVLRDSDSLTGKCGGCEYRNLCGGSRSRAFALTGDYLASDPRCSYMPVGAA
ncbi:TIGR04053 family radical SAM/SPASM domain-containing protein [uncultured Paludibaculum sp.]|uniref:TIGR04053 family radical SAM/SPASM domain-containing protein n=1 Tax=uncultured Paludibaculum sp. TaxID=1765020 RepID=UPI002AAAB27E|nr:TIGR04053 family radical SAM/SPASM domain-containing protein [uncultured Paludibaculum sp.]